MVILCDLSEVLIYGFLLTKDIFSKRYLHANAECYWSRHGKMEDKLKELFRGKISEDEYWKEFKSDQYFLSGISPDEYKDILGKSMNHTVPGTYKVLKALRDNPENRITGMYIVSDHIKERIGFIRETYPEIRELFDHFFWSCDLGMIKQDDGFFKKVIEQIKVDPDNIIYIDDMRANLDAAEKAGITKLIKFENADDLKKILINHYCFAFKDAVVPT